MSLKTVILLFSSEGCVHCRLQKSLLEKAALPEGVELKTVLLQDDLASFRRFGVQGTPTLLLLKGENEVRRWRGVVQAREVLAAVEAALGDGKPDEQAVPSVPDFPESPDFPVDQSPEGALQWAAERFAGELVFLTSFGAEDQVIAEMIVRKGLDIPFATLDTGRLFPETVEVWAETERRYGIKVRPYSPRPEDVEEALRPLGMRESLEARRECCRARKLLPLGRALAGRKLWVCGLRRGQGISRSEVRLLENDAAHNLLKLNPIWDWSEEQVWQRIRDRDIPYNVLHDRGYPSIGCSLCTRSVRRTEDVRSGRWWWEEPKRRECGLHTR